MCSFRVLAVAYQDVIDRFVRGEDVPDDSLRSVWQNITQPDTLWDVLRGVLPSGTVRQGEQNDGLHSIMVGRWESDS